MKINTDSTWGKILDESNTHVLLSLDKWDYTQLINKIFSKTQQLRHIEHDGTFTLSKKGQKILLEEIAKTKTK
jgi:hypothetical protein